MPSWVSHRSSEGSIALKVRPRGLYVAPIRASNRQHFVTISLDAVEMNDWPVMCLITQLTLNELCSPFEDLIKHLRCPSGVHTLLFVSRFQVRYWHSASGSGSRRRRLSRFHGSLNYWFL